MRVVMIQVLAMLWKIVPSFQGAKKVTREDGKKGQYLFQGAKKGSWVLNNEGYQTMREVVCQRQGFDKRTKSKTKGCHCKAMIRLHRTEDDGWFISTYVKEHNHEFSETDGRETGMEFT
uniref:FAR1 domain-containing protein n=1 Tax=Setaria italica TaxID=4555 RepID=K3YWT8_SETIT